jgi:2-succinyl-5-enolpyruvyl-6-hydroxy-3-cyclohexene-1-carboxylate synthase
MNNKSIENKIYANRGTSGIDGCSSTAIGNALVSDQNVKLITGDVAFFYDVNAFFNEHVPQNLKIIVLNNHGGGIFNLIKGPESLGESIKFQTTPHYLNASSLCDHFGIPYFVASDMSSLRSSYNQFNSYQGAAVLELVTDEQENQNAFNNFLKL